jgi:hypothetical protein
MKRSAVYEGIGRQNTTLIVLTAVLSPERSDGRERPNARACYTPARAPTTHTGGGLLEPLPVLLASRTPSPPCRSKRFPAAPMLLPCFPHACGDHLCPCRRLPPLPAPAA